MTEFSEMIALARTCSPLQTPEDIHIYETAMTLTLKWAQARAAKMPRHLYDAALCEDVVWDTFTLVLERFNRYYDPKRVPRKNPCTFMWDWCIGQCLDKALAMHLPGRFYGATCHTHSEAQVGSLEGLQEHIAKHFHGAHPGIIWEERDRIRDAADMERLECRDAAEAAMATLTDDERDIIEQRYYKHRTFREIAETRTQRIGPEKGLRKVTHQRIQQMHAEALAKMRRFLSKEATCGTPD